MKTYVEIFRLAKAHAIGAAIYSLAVLPAFAQQDYEGSGVVGPAKCAEASVFKDLNGRSFEIDNSRVVLAKGVPISVRGKVYARISVCKVYPWLDVVGTSADPVGRRDVASSGSASFSGADGTVELMLDRSDMGPASAWLAQLRTRTDISKIHIRVSDGALQRLPDLLLSMGAAGPELMSKAEITSTPGRPTFSWVANGQKRTFKSLTELKNALLN